MASWINEFYYRRNGMTGVLHIIILLLSIFLIVDISWDVFNDISYLSQKRYLKTQLFICSFFIFAFILEFFLTDDKWHYVKTHILFLIVCIPYTNIIDHYGFYLTPTEHYLIRFMPLVRSGYALAIVVGWLTSNKASGLFMSYLTMLAATVYFGSLLFFVVEHKINPEVKNYQDSLWWACMNMTTVGSNIYAITPTGRVLSVLLSALGMMMFPIFTVYVTNLVQTANQEKEDYYKNELNKERKKTEEAEAIAKQAVNQQQINDQASAQKSTPNKE